MRFFQNRGVAIAICILMIVTALGIGKMKQPSVEYAPDSDSSAEAWGKENYTSYLHFLEDETGVLKDRTLEELSAINAALD